MIYNFNSGPAMLPPEVLQQASEAVLHYKAHQSILEISHRSYLYEEILDEAKSLLKELCELNDDFEILYLSGGASNLFAMIPMNFLTKNKSAAFVNTGYWSEKAIAATKYFSKVKIIASSENRHYNYIPSFVTKNIDAEYLHITTNNTIEGTQWKNFEKFNIPLFADMSSDILSRKINYNQFDFIYASTHKNLGTAGSNIVLLKKNLLEKINENVPAIFNFKNHVDAKSIYSTPSVYAVFISLLMLRWMKKQTLKNIFANNNLKAKMLYEAIDANPNFICEVEKEFRSQMNIVFKAKEKLLEEKFMHSAASNEIINIAGHRTAGGFRASIYNAMPMAGVEKLAALIRNFN